MAVKKKTAMAVRPPLKKKLDEKKKKNPKKAMAPRPPSKRKKTSTKKA